jgi:hypothetical protein
MGRRRGWSSWGRSFTRQLATDHEGKRSRIVAALNDAGMKPYIPRGAYYVLADASGLPGETAAIKARWLLARRAWLRWRGRRSFAPGAGRTCCGSALRRRITIWTTPAHGCGRSGTGPKGPDFQAIFQGDESPCSLRKGCLKKRLFAEKANRCACRRSRD